MPWRAREERALSTRLSRAETIALNTRLQSSEIHNAALFYRTCCKPVVVLYVWIQLGKLGWSLKKQFVSALDSVAIILHCLQWGVTLLRRQHQEDGVGGVVGGEHPLHRLGVQGGRVPTFTLKLCSNSGEINANLGRPACISPNVEIHAKT